MIFKNNNTGLDSLNLLCGKILIDGRIVVSVANSGLYISDAPKNNSINTGGWIDQGKYLENKLYLSRPDYVKFSNDGRKIFTSYNGLLKIIDTQTGIMLNSHQFPNLGYYKTIVSSDDSNVIIINYVTEGYDEVTKIYTSVYNINNFQLLFKYETYTKFYFCPPHVMSKNDMGSVNADFVLSKNKFINSYLCYRCCESDISLCKTLGKLFYGDFKLGQIFLDTISQAPILDILLFKDNKYVILVDSSGSYFVYSDPYSYGSQNIKKLIYGDFKDKSSNILYEIYTTDNYLSLRKLNEQIFCSLIDSKKLLFWDIDSLKRIDSCFLPSLQIDYEFTKDNNKVILGYDTGLYIYSVSWIKLLDSIPFPYETGYNWLISVSPDSQSVAFASFDGVLRLFKLGNYTEVPGFEKIKIINKESNSLVLYPNPGSNVINIKADNLNNIELFSIEGIKLKEINSFEQNPIQIDISDLVSGVYFVRNGFKTSKFIKYNF